MRLPGQFPRLAGLVLAIAPSVALAQRPTFTEQSVIVPGREGRRLAGTLSLPDGAGPFPVVVTITGSGAHLRDGNRTAADRYRPFRDIAAAVAKAGIATLRLDDRGTGESTGSATAADGDDVADDVRVAIAWLRRHPRIDPGRVGLIGHSFGGAVAPMVAADDPRIAAVVLMGAPARNFRETMRYQLAYTIGRDSSIESAERAAALDAAMRRQEQNVAASVEQWRPWLQDYDPLPVAARVGSPVLIVHGTTDRAVPLADAEMLYTTMSKAGNTRVTLRLFDNLNHHFQRDPVGAREGYASLPTQELAPEFLEAITQWLSAVFASRTM